MIKLKPLLLEQESEQPKVVYIGRFQPFSKHHFAAYKWLVNKYGKDNVYIGTSNKTEIKSPLNFKNKKLIMSKYKVIPLDHIIQVEKQYSKSALPTSLQSYPIIFAYGKNSKPGNGYINAKNITTFDPEKKYIIEIPYQSIDLNKEDLSGTVVRRIFADPESSMEEKRKKMKYIFGFEDDDILTILTNALMIKTNI